MKTIAALFRHIKILTGLKQNKSHSEFWVLRFLLWPSFTPLLDLEFWYIEIKIDLTTQDFNFFVYPLLKKIGFLNKYFVREQIIFNKRRFSVLYHLNVGETNDLWKNVFV